jgi:RNA polymerase primary sigma factor
MINLILLGIVPSNHFLSQQAKIKPQKNVILSNYFESDFEKAYQNNLVKTEHLFESYATQVEIANEESESKNIIYSREFKTIEEEKVVMMDKTPNDLLFKSTPQLKQFSADETLGNSNQFSRLSRKYISHWFQKNDMLLTNKNASKIINKNHVYEKSIEILLSNKSLNQKGLLTANEEKKYGKMVQQLLKIQSLERYMFKNNGCQPTTTELAEIFKMDEASFINFRSTCVSARRHMVNSNLRLVISVAKKIHVKKSGMNLHDLVTVGIDGLTRAVEKFDPSKGYKFSTYAHWWIRQAVDRFVLEQRTIKVPIHLWEILSKIRKGQRALNDKLHREPTYKEVGTLLGIDPDRVANIVHAYQDTESLDATFGGNGSNQSPREEVLVSDSDKMEPSDHLKALELSDIRLQAKIEALIKVALTERQAEIVRMRYGLDDGIPKTLDEIGERFQVTRERVRQIEAKVARKLILSKQREKIQWDLGGILEVTTGKSTVTRATGLLKSN